MSKHRTFHPLLCYVIAAVLLAACQAQSGEVTVPTVMLPTTAPTTTATVASTIAATADSALRTYTDPEGWWSIQYPADILQVEDLGQGTIVFISKDRKTVVAVDSYDAEGHAYGNTGEDLRNRARDTLARIYGKPVNETGITGPHTGGWETRITFSTEKGSTGEALYQQPGRDQRDFQVYGILYGYRADAEATQLALVQHIRNSFRITAEPPSGG